MADKTQQYQRYKKAIARIYSSDGAIVGSGFLVSNSHILTCAHVVADALGIEHTTQDFPQDFVEIDFPFSDNKKGQKIKAKVVFWKPISSLNGWNQGDDIAGLKLERDLAKEISPGLVLGDYSWTSFKVFGVPNGNDSGVWTKGELRDEVENGQVQVNVLEQSDYYVESGFSGAPVWVESLNGVVGIIVAAEPSENEKRKQVKAAFMIPTKVLIEFWSYLKNCITPTSKSKIELSKPSQLPKKAQPSFNQRVATHFLNSLNYETQKQDFIEAIKRDKQGVFLIQAKNRTIQNWLVWRLTKCIPDFQRIPNFQQTKPFTIWINHQLKTNFNLFWQQFGELGNNREAVVQGLANLCQQRSVVIVLYGFSSLDKEKVSQLYNFWLDLVNKFRSISEKKHCRSRLILLLVEKNNSTVLDKLHQFNFIQASAINQTTFETNFSVKLKPLNKILRCDVKTWLDQNDEVYEVVKLNQTYDVESIYSSISDWDEEPEEMLDEICKSVFNIKPGMPAIDNFWKF